MAKVATKFVDLEARARSPRAVQSRQRGLEPGFGVFGFGKTLALFLDYLFGRAGDEVRIAEFLLDPVDLGAQIGDFLRQPILILVSDVNEYGGTSRLRGAGPLRMPPAVS